MTYALIVKDTVVAYPYSLRQLCADNPDVSFPREPTDETFATYGAVPIAPSGPPATTGKVPVETMPVKIKGIWTQAWDEEDAPRRMVRKSTITARLIEAEKMAAAHAALMSSPNNFARWIAADRPAIYADDPDALTLLTAIGADIDVMMAPEEE